MDDTTTTPRFATFRRGLAVGAVALIAVVGWPTVDAAASEPDRSLVKRVPSSFASTCASTSVDHMKRAAAAIVCTPPRRSEVTRVTYVRFPNAKAARAYYDDQADGPGHDTETDCADLTESESPYHTTSGRQGRLTCTVSKHRSMLTWVDQAVVATAVGDEDIPVYTWWEQLVGRTLTDTQQALLADLPGGFSRSTCRDNGDASLKCWPFEEEDVYIVYFTKYADADALAAAYDDVLSEAGLGRDMTPPGADPSACSFETFWGPDQNGVATEELGRIACIELSDSTALVWTRDASNVLTRVEGFSPEIVYQHFQQYSGATAETTGA